MTSILLEEQGRFQPKNSDGGIAPSAPSSPSPFYPSPETEKVRTPYHIGVHFSSLVLNLGATSESGGTCPLPQRRIAPRRREREL